MNSFSDDLTSSIVPKPPSLERLENMLFLIENQIRELYSYSADQEIRDRIQKAELERDELKKRIQEATPLQPFLTGAVVAERQKEHLRLVHSRAETLGETLEQAEQAIFREYEERRTGKKQPETQAKDPVEELLNDMESGKVSWATSKKAREESLHFGAYLPMYATSSRLGSISDVQRESVQQSLKKIQTKINTQIEVEPPPQPKIEYTKEELKQDRLRLAENEYRAMKESTDEFERIGYQEVEYLLNGMPLEKKEEKNEKGTENLDLVGPSSSSSEDH